MSADDYARRDPAWVRLPASLSDPVRAAAVEGAALTAILAAAVVLFRRGLALPPSFDEGVYLAQTDALLHGQRLGVDVFAAQPPGFHWLLLLAARVGGLDVDRMRLAVLALAVAGLLAAYLVARALAGPVAGLLAAAVLAVAPPYPTFSAAVMADLPGTALALLSLACLLWARGRWWLYALGGVLFAAAEWVKLDAFVVVLPALVYVALRRLGIALGAAAAATAVGLGVLAGSLPEVWRGAVSYHLAARGAPGHSANVHALRAFFDLHQPFTWLVALALVLTLALRLRRLWPLWATAAVAAGFLLWHRPLHDNHFVLLAVVLAAPVAAALAAGIRRLPVLGLVVVLALAAGYVQETRRLDRNAGPVPPELVAAAQRVDAHSRPGRLVVSDEPLVPVLAHRRMPGRVIDTAVLRFDSGYLSDADVIAAVESGRVPVVVAGRSFLQRPKLLAWLRARFPLAQREGGVTVYSR